MTTHWLSTAVRESATCGLYFGLGFFSYLIDEAVVQPHPAYIDGSWFTECLPAALHYGLWCAVGMGIIYLADWWATRGTSYIRRAFPYYPRINKLPQVLGQRNSILVMAAGGLVLGSYYALEYASYCRAANYPHGMIWPSHWLLVTCVFVWCLLWICDTLQRSDRGTVVIAIVFTVWALIGALPAAFSGVVE